MPNNYSFNTSASDLKSQVYGANAGNLLPIQTDTTGNVIIGGGTITILGGSISIAGGSVEIAGVSTTSSFTVITAATSTAVLTVDSSQQKTYSYYIYNTSTGTVTAQLEVSPTTTNEFFVADSSLTLVVPTNGKAVMFTKYYLDYTRLSIQTLGGTVSVYYNAQV